MEKYGTTSPMKTKEIQDKVKQTCMDKYGVKWAAQSEEVREKMKQTNRGKYGVKCVFQSEEIKEKIKQTCMEKYGVENGGGSDVSIEKIKQTCMKRYNVTNYSYTDEFKEKNYQTKRKNNTFHTSSIEDRLYKWLVDNNINTIRQYKSELYPYHCDYYLPDYDLYIELQGTWTHGHHPFNENNPSDLNVIKFWESKNTDYYSGAIKTWTISDVMKRKTASKNNLNYLEIFSCDLNFCIKQIKERIF